MRSYAIQVSVGLSALFWIQKLIEENRSLRVQREIALEVIDNHAKLGRYLIDMLKHNGIEPNEFDDIVLESLYRDLMKIKRGGA